MADQSPTAVTTPRPFDAQGRLAHHLSCLFCGHDLRGLPADGSCGECGRPVAWSLLDNPLMGAEPPWRRRVWRAAAVLPWVLPWVWLPLAWPLLVWCFVLLTSPERSIRVMPTAMSWTLRAIPLLAVIGGWIGWTLQGFEIYVYVAVVGPFALMLLLVAPVLSLIARHGRVHGIRRMLRFGMFTFGLLLTIALFGAAMEMLMPDGIWGLLGGIGGVLAVPAAVLLAIQTVWALGALRKPLERAEIIAANADSPLRRPAGRGFTLPETQSVATPSPG